MSRSRSRCRCRPGGRRPAGPITPPPAACSRGSARGTGGRGLQAPARAARRAPGRAPGGLRDAPRARRSIGFVVGPEGLSVSVPRWVGVAEVDSALQDKRGWILRKLREQRERAQRLQSARIDWRDGTELPFLGDTVILVLDARAAGAVLDNGADALPGVPRRMLRVRPPGRGQDRPRGGPPG